MTIKSQKIILGPRQASNVARAIDDLLDAFSSFPFSIGDILDRAELENIYRSRCLLLGEKFDRGYYFGEEDED